MTGPGMEELRDARRKLEPRAVAVERVDMLPVPAGPGPDVLHVLHSRLALTDPEVLKGQLAAYSAARKLFVDWLFGNLTAGVDYMLIHRKIGRGQNRQDCPQKANRTGRGCEKCGGKATLCKPGSEKICGLLRLRPRFRKDEETWAMLGGDAGTLAFICELVDETSGAVVAEGRGCRTKAQDYDDINKTVKMVQKSAQTDAVLRCAGLSEVFTQDLEDMPAGGNGGDRSDITPPPPITGAPDDPEPADAEVDAGAPPPRVTISEAQFRLLMAETHKGRGEPALRDKLKRQLKLEHIHELPLELFDAVLAWAKQKPVGITAAGRRR